MSNDGWGRYGAPHVPWEAPVDDPPLPPLEREIFWLRALTRDLIAEKDKLHEEKGRLASLLARGSDFQGKVLIYREALKECVDHLHAIRGHPAYTMNPAQLRRIEALLDPDA